MICLGILSLYQYLFLLSLLFLLVTLYCLLRVSLIYFVCNFCLCARLLKQTLDYARECQRYKNKEASLEARALSKKYLDRFPELHEFEIATLNNLRVETSDEGFSLVPSLISKLTKEQLDALLEDLARCESA
jgi:hypothetical protein